MSTWLVPRNRWLCGQRTSCCTKVENVDPVVLRRKTQQRSKKLKKPRSTLYHGLSYSKYKKMRFAMTKCVNCIFSCLVMFIFENIKLILDKMMSYLLEYVV